MYRVIIPQGHSLNHETLISRLRACVGYDFRYHNYDIRDSKVTFDIYGRDLAIDIRGSSHTLPLTDFDVVIMVKSIEPPELEMCTEDKELMETVMMSRFNYHKNSLCLADFASDPEFRKAKTIIPLSEKAVLTILVEMIVRNIPHISHIDLSDNRIHTLEPLRELSESCPALTKLNLSNNLIHQAKEFWALEQMPLSDIYIAGNPVCETELKQTIERESFVTNIIPDLLRIDRKAVNQCKQPNQNYNSYTYNNAAAPANTLWFPMTCGSRHR